MNIITTLLPIFLPLILILVFKLNSFKTMIITLILFVILLFWFFKMSFFEFEKNALNALFQLLTPIWILFGSIFLLNILEQASALQKIKRTFNTISADQRIQVIIIGFLFSALIEGISGFGIPATIAAPILISLGYKPLQAIIISLCFNSIPVSFGATGIPINFGLIEPLKKNLIFSNFQMKNNLNSEQILNLVANKVIFTNYILIPLILTMVMFLVTIVFVKKENRSWKDFYQMLPLIILTGVIYPSIEFLVLKYVGYSFVSILTPISMLIIIFIIIKFKIKYLAPNKIFHKYYGNKNEIAKMSRKKNIKITTIKAWIPYLLVIFLLLIVRIIPFLKAFVKSFVITYNKLNFEFLFNPGFTFLIVGIFSIKFYKINIWKTIKILKNTTHKISSSILVLIPTFILIEIFMHANVSNTTISNEMSVLISKFIGPNWQIFSPFLGLIGSFINGSATVSNISFGSVQVAISNLYNYNMINILTFQQIGANMGNMICISNIIVVCSVVGIKNKESNILKYTITISLILIVFVIILLNIFK